MNTKRTLKWGLVTAAATCAAVAAMPGCELLVDFDRSKIPSEGGAADVTMPPNEGGGEAAPPDAPSEVGMGDAPPDVPAETTMNEGGMDAHPETGNEAGPEGGDGGDGSMAAPIFAITPTTMDYGTVRVGTTTAAFTFTITNSGGTAGTPTVTPGGANAGEFAATGCTTSVAAGASCTLSVTFAPGGVGGRAGTIGVGSTTATLSGTGAGAGPLTINMPTPPTLSFGTVATGMSSTEMSVTVFNTDTVNDVTLGNANIDGQNLQKFHTDPDGGATQCTGTLAANATCTLFLHFAPTAAGFQYASLSISGIATDGGTAPGTASVSLTGTGQ
jgi:hypothetical protein